MGKPFCFIAGGLACFCEGDAVNVDVGTRLMETREDTLANLTGLISRAFGKKDDNLTKFGVGAFCD